MTGSTTRTTPGRSGPAIAALVGTLAAGWWLLSLGHGVLASPSLAHPATWPAWIERGGAGHAAFATMRVLCLVAAPYVALCLLLGLLAGRLRHERLQRVARRVCLAPLRPLLDALVG